MEVVIDTFLIFWFNSIDSFGQHSDAPQHHTNHGR